MSQVDTNLIVPTPISVPKTLVPVDEITHGYIKDIYNSEPNWEDWENAS
jgi:hypothetical protein